MLDLDAYEQEVDLADDHVLQVVSGEGKESRCVSRESESDKAREDVKVVGVEGCKGKRRTSTCCTRTLCADSPQFRPPS